MNKQDQDNSGKQINHHLASHFLFLPFLQFILTYFLPKTIILPVVLYGCETWSHTLREERRLRVFENRILRRIFEPKWDENGEWRRLHIVCTVHLI